MTRNITKKGVLGASSIEIGRFTYGFETVTVKQWNEGASLNIGSFCSIAANVTIFIGGDHRTDWISTFPFGHIFQDELGGEGIKGHPATKGDVIIGNDVWIGTGVSIMTGICIGDGAVLAANANVVKDVLPYSIVGGNPAKLLKKRFDEETIKLLQKLKWWNLPLEQIKEIESELCSPPSKELINKLILKYRS
jgi:acetyltransferase-like isoleucine patch superfamily enzyme